MFSVMLSNKAINQYARLRSSGFHLGRTAAGCAALFVAAMLLSGCQGIAAKGTPSPQVRVIDASPDAPDLDVYQNSGQSSAQGSSQSSARLAHDLGFGTITSYSPVEPGGYTTETVVAGSRQVVSSNKDVFTNPAQYTILIGNTVASLEQTTLEDRSQPAPNGQVLLRFIHLATRVGGLDAYLVPAGKKFIGVTPTATSLVLGGNTGYLSAAPGAYTLVLLPAGTTPASDTVAAYSGAQITYPPGSAGTIVLIDQKRGTAAGLQVLNATDFVPPDAIIEK